MNKIFKTCFVIVVIFFVSKSNICPEQLVDQNEIITLDPQCFRKVYDSDKFDGHKLSRILNQRIGNYKRILQDIKMKNIQHLKTQPVIKWAQSQSQIFLNLRLSHRHDSPTCSDIRFQSIQTDVKQYSGDIQIIKMQKNTQYLLSKINFLSQCYFTHQKLLFALDLDFNSTITKINVKKQGFGRYTIIADKQINQIWSHPFTGSKNAGIWSQMRTKYSSDMDKYFQIIQEIKQKTSSSKGIKKNRNKKVIQTQQQTINVNNQSTKQL